MIRRKTGSKNRSKTRGRLRIGDDWNAITIIALSQSNPLKAVAEFVENSIDAQAKTVTIIRGREKGRQYLKVVDDGEGIPCSENGIPDFKYVATHICDSLKRRLKKEGFKSIQGEFGIGLLSFWTVGDKLTLISSGSDGKTYQMNMEKGKPGYAITPRPRLLPAKGTQLVVSSLLAGIRMLNGERIQRYLASELRDRIRRSGVKVRIIDRTARVHLEVEPRRYSGRLLHDLPVVKTDIGDIYTELYLNEKNSENRISLFKSGTRIFPAITELEAFHEDPWTSCYFQGIIDVPFLRLTPGTRGGIIHDDRFALFCEAVIPLKRRLAEIAAEQIKSEEERMSRNILRSVQKALREAIFNLPREEYDWFDMYEKNKSRFQGNNLAAQEGKNALTVNGIEEEKKPEKIQKEFFEFPGPLFSAKISPASAIVPVKERKTFRAIGFDRRKRQVEENLTYEWKVSEGGGSLDRMGGEIAAFTAPEEPGLAKLELTVRQGDIACRSENIITVVDSLVQSPAQDRLFLKKGLPGYTLESAPGQTWRSHYDTKRNIVIINSGHRDFIYAGKERMRKIRYISRLFAKELIHHNFTGSPAEELLERLVELSLYVEENLK